MSTCNCIKHGSTVIDTIDEYEIIICDSCGRTYKKKIAIKKGA